MSSSYRVLCLSHDPATEAGEYRTPQDAETAIAEGIPGHPRCDLVIGRYSTPLVELGCPPSRLQTAPACCHNSTVWIESRWLRLLALANDSTDPAIQDAALKARQGCLMPQRLTRLRDELGL